MDDVQLRGPDGEKISIPGERVEGLAEKLHGPLLRPGDAGYDEARTVWNAMIDRRPGLIARCTGPADVMDAVDFAADHGVRLSVKGGGHNIAGAAVPDGGLTLDLSHLREVRVDPRDRTVRVGPGATLADLDRHTQAFGLAVPTGIVSATGVAGLTLGGGFGWLSRAYGYTCDNLLSMDVVTADGELVVASEEENEDLFWALSGGGGNFGVVTSFQFQAHPVGPEVLAGMIAWPFERVQEVVRLFRELTADAPRDLSCLLVLRPAPPAPFLPEEVHGELIAAIAVCWTGDQEEGEALLEPLREQEGVLGDVIAAKPFTTHQKMLDKVQPEGRRYYWKSEYVNEVDGDLGDVLERHTRTITSPHAAILVFQLGGAIRDHDGETAASGRDAEFLVNLAGSWEDPSDDEEQIGWARAAWEDLLPHATLDTYVNFLTEDEGEEQVRRAYAGSYERLAVLKERFDPDCLFAGNRTIRPSD